MRLWAALMVAGLGSGAQAQPVCAGDVVFQCALDAPWQVRDQITVCRDARRFEMVRHRLATKDFAHDTPLRADAATTHYRFVWRDARTLGIELGFWDAAQDHAWILHMALPLDEDADTPLPGSAARAWLRAGAGQDALPPEPCLPRTVHADPESMDAALDDRGPVGLFFSGSPITPRPGTVARARVVSAAPVAVYQWPRPNAATPVWWRLASGAEVDVIDRHGDYRAVAIPIDVEDCMIRPKDIGVAYAGPCATGWVEERYLRIVQ